MSAKKHTADDHARALGIILRDEFDVAFAFQDAATGTRVSSNDVDIANFLDKQEVSEVAAQGVVVARHGTGSFRISIPIYISGQAAMVATGLLPAVARIGEEDPREFRRLERWARGVHDRLRLSGSVAPSAMPTEDRAKPAWESVLALNHLIHKSRPHRNSQSAQERILSAARRIIGCRELVWIPECPDTSVVPSSTVLSSADLRRLVALLTRSRLNLAPQPLVCNDVQQQSWSSQFPSIANLMIVPATDQDTIGWVVAINRTSGTTPETVTPFRTADLAVLAPFVSLIEMQARTAARYQDLKNLLVGLTRSLSAALDAKDHYTQGHSARVARIAVEIGRCLGMDEDEIGNLYLAGLLHDIGKIGIRESILGKPGPLTSDEFDEMKRHVTIGHAILADLHQLRSLLPGVLYHHERYDGGGYPEGLVGESIPLLGRILAVADSYDAMTSSRPYRKGMTHQNAIDALNRDGGRQWDPRIVDAALRCMEKIRFITQRGIGGDSLRRALDGAMGASGHDSGTGNDTFVVAPLAQHALDANRILTGA